MTPEDLNEQAREHYQEWRRLGLSETDALAEVERSGIHHEAFLYDLFRSQGLSENAARFAARGRDGGAEPVGGFDSVVATYRSLGMSENAARLAAIGRDQTEQEARESWDRTILRKRFGEADRPKPKLEPVPEPVPEGLVEELTEQVVTAMAAGGVTREVARDTIARVTGEESAARNVETFRRYLAMHRKDTTAMELGMRTEAAGGPPPKLSPQPVEVVETGQSGA